MTPTDDRAGPLTLNGAWDETVIVRPSGIPGPGRAYCHLVEIVIGYSGERGSMMAGLSLPMARKLAAEIMRLADAAESKGHASPAPTPADSRGHPQHPRAPGADRAPGAAGPGLGLGVDAAGGAGGRVVGGQAGRGAGDAEAAEDRAGGGAEAAGLTGWRSIESAPYATPLPVGWWDGQFWKQTFGERWASDGEWIESSQNTDCETVIFPTHFLWPSVLPVAPEKAP